MSGTISFDGLATGINSSDTVDKIMAVEARPKTLKEAEQQALINQSTAWQEIDTKLLDLREKSKSLWSSTTWSTLAASTSDSDVLTATATSSAREGTYSFQVTKLARSHMLASNGYESSLADVGTGSLTIGAGGATATISIDATNNTLAGVAEAINDADVGVTASVINDGTAGTGYKLLLTSDETGTSHDIEVSAAGLTLSFPTTVQTSQNAEIQFGTMTITSESNSVSEVIEGVTLNLLAERPLSTVTVTVARDTAELEKSIQAFTDSYNSAMGFIASQFLYNDATKTGGILMGDQALVTIQDRIQRMLVSPVATGGAYQSLQSVGLVLADDGTLSFDAAKFSTAVSKDYQSVEKLFRTTGSVSHAKMSFVYAGKRAAEPTTSGYSVDITRVATRSYLTGDADVGSLDIDGTNDTLTVALNDGATFQVALTHKTYATLSELATEVQQSINGAAPSGDEVSVALDGNRLVITSQRYGSASKVAISGGSGRGNLGFGTSTLTAGVDVAGTINGEAATGSGQILTGDKGNAKTEGVQVKVELSSSDLVAGAEGTVFFTKGVAARFNEYLQDLTDPVLGTIETRREGLDKNVEDLQAQMDEMQERLDAKRESLMEQFRKMEEAVSKLNGQSNYLMNALSGLSSNWQWNS